MSLLDAISMLGVISVAIISFFSWMTLAFWACASLKEAIDRDYYSVSGWRFALGWLVYLSGMLIAVAAYFIFATYIVNRFCGEGA